MDNTNHTRRKFIKALAYGSVASSFPSIIRSASAANSARVVVIGGGFAGATAAKYLKHWSPNLQVTLVEANSQYYSPILSNLILNGQKSLSNLTFNYNSLSQKYGVNVINDWVQGIDSGSKQVELQSGQKLAYDRLIVAPGISFKTVSGHDTSKVLHAWKSGSQVQQLKQQLDVMPAGGTFIMTIPPAPYRCPPGPYERACLVADYLKRNKPGSKVLVLDANADILAEKHTFSQAFNVTYAGIIDYKTNINLEAVDSNQLIAVTSSGDFKADVLNVIPTHAAGNIISRSGLANSNNGLWADVDPISYESTAASGIHIIGDSQGTNQPKAGHIANAEAKVCADAVIRLLGGGQPYASPKTNSACYSPISTNTASWATVVYQYNPMTKSMQAVQGSGGVSDSASSRNYRDMFRWSKNLFSDTFS